MWSEYLFPTSVKETLMFLSKSKGEARIIAGGTDLIPQLKRETRQLKCLIDITNIRELCKIVESGDSITIGAGVTHSHVISSDLIKNHAIVLAEAASCVGSPLIRNQGTIVGNVVNAQPAADTALALFALNANIEIHTQTGKKLVPIADLYYGPGISAVDSSSELVTSIHFQKLGRNSGSAFVRLSQRKALTLPVLNVAVVVMLTNDQYTSARIAIGPVAQMPFRSEKAELFLKGTRIHSESIMKAAELSAEDAQPRDSALRGSAGYRQQMVKVLVRRALEKATQRAQAK